MPVVSVLSCALILYSVTDAGMRELGWPGWAVFCWVAVMLVVTVIIWRYTRVEMEYMWFSGELVVRRSDRMENYRLVVRQEEMEGMRDRSGSMGRCFFGGRTLNCCATLRGRVWDCCTLYYHDAEGRAWRLRFQPAGELRMMLAQAVQTQMEKA
ncbi:hypothetical protein [Intestinibacillus massiliensis]